jgi:aspartate racemase
MLTDNTAPSCVGILGGMGPRATVDFFQKLVEATPAARDRDHIPVLIYSIPQIPDRTDAILHGGPSPLEDMCRGVRTLQSAGASVIAVACNTAHFWFEEMQQNATVPLLHIAEAVLDELRPAIAPGAAIGILATSGTIHSKIYSDALHKGGFACLVLPDLDQKGVDAGISLVKAGHTDEAGVYFQRGIAQLVAQGAKAVILACTEIPLAVRSGTTPVFTVDATAALARRCVGYFVARGEI